MTPDVADVGEVAEQLANDRLGPPAIGALEVAVLDHGHRCMAGAPDVIAVRVDLVGEVGEQLGGAQEDTIAPTLREQVGGAEREPGDERRAGDGAENAELGLLELGPRERQARDQQGHGEADPGDRPAAGDGRPADRRAESAATEPGDQPRTPTMPTGLPIT